MKKCYVCRCFFTKNIFIKDLGIHVQFENRDAFRKNYQQVLEDKGYDTSVKQETILKQIEDEVKRRQHLGQESIRRQELIRTSYVPLHREVYSLKKDYLAGELLSLVSYCQSGQATANGVKEILEGWQKGELYMFRVFEKKFCELLLEELEHFEESECPKGRPNTMNKYGVLLDEVGLGEGFISPLIHDYISPITRLLFPDWGGDSIDSYKAFVVKYKVGEDLDLAYHYDNAEITLNVALGKEFTEGTLYFGGMRYDNDASPTFLRYDHVPQFGLLHRGQHLHGAMPIEDGERYNLIVWMRSSRIRNSKCPMCDEKPDLVETVGIGDGFTLPEDMVNVCTTV